MQSSNSPSSSGPSWGAPMPLTIAVSIIVMVVAAWMSFSMGGVYFLLAIPLLPILVLAVDRLEFFYIGIFTVASAGVWLPNLPGELSLALFLRYAFLGLLVARGIIVKSSREQRNGVRIFIFVFAAIVIMTMVLRGSGFRSIGSNLWGGKYYVMLAIPLLWYLMVPRAVSLTPKQWKTLVILTALVPIFGIIGDLLYLKSGGRFYQLYYIFRPAADIGRAGFELESGGTFWRLKSLARFDISLLALLYWPTLRKKAFGFLLLVCLLLIHLFLAGMSGHRLSLLGIIGFVSIYFYVGYPKHRIRMFLTGSVLAILFLLVTVLAASHLPSPVQRAVSWIPGADVPAEIQESANYSLQWRVDMWKVVIRTEIPKYWLIGRGLAYHPEDYISVESKGFMGGYWYTIQNYIVSGNLHNGPLSVLVFFGASGLIALTLVMVLGVRRYYRFFYLDWKDLMSRNIYLIFLSMLLWNVASFFFIYGDLRNSVQRVLYLMTSLEILVRTRTERRNKEERAEEPRLR